MWTSSAKICDVMTYDVTTQFFPQFLTFKMAEESVAREDVAREDVATLRTKYDTGHDLFAPHPVLSSSSHLLQLPRILSSYITRTRESENWLSNRTIRSILLMKLLKIAQFDLHFAPIWVRRRFSADGSATHWTGRQTLSVGNGGKIAGRSAAYENQALESMFVCFFKVHNEYPHP